MHFYNIYNYYTFIVTIDIPQQLLIMCAIKLRALSLLLLLLLHVTITRVCLK